MYADPGGRKRFPLDERIGLKQGQLASPSATECLVRMAASEPFRAVAENASSLTACELSAKTIHRMVQNVGEEALAEERERWEAEFERGGEAPEGDEEVDVLHTEADGVWVRLRREARKSHEVKCAISCTGWNPVVGEDRCELVGKWMYGHGNESIPFW